MDFKAESLRLGDFNREEMLILLNEHTIETSQEFFRENSEHWIERFQYLVIFDRDPQRSWDEKVFMRDMEIKDRKIRVWGV